MNKYYTINVSLCALHELVQVSTCRLLSSTDAI